MSTKEAYEAELAAYLKGFAENVRRLQAERDLTQAELQDVTNLHRTQIGRIANAKVEPKLTTLAILADGLKVPLDALIAGLPVPKERKPPPRPKRERKTGQQ
jgi:transcriptional regulator with XRE-family HTH domain